MPSELRKTVFKDKRRRKEYGIYLSTKNIWLKARSISEALDKHTLKIKSFNESNFDHVVSCYLGELEGIVRSNHRESKQFYKDSCLRSIKPRLLNILSLYNNKNLVNAQKIIKIKHEINEMRVASHAMCKRLDKLY